MVIDETRSDEDEAAAENLRLTEEITLLREQLHFLRHQGLVILGSYWAERENNIDDAAILRSTTKNNVLNKKHETSFWTKVVTTWLPRAVLGIVASIRDAWTTPHHDSFSAGPFSMKPHQKYVGRRSQ